MMIVILQERDDLVRLSMADEHGCPPVVDQVVLCTQRMTLHIFSRKSSDSDGVRAQLSVLHVTDDFFQARCCLYALNDRNRVPLMYH